jgi:hypothetical protein
LVETIIELSAEPPPLVVRSRESSPDGALSAARLPKQWRSRCETQCEKCGV